MMSDGTERTERTGAGRDGATHESARGWVHPAATVAPLDGAGDGVELRTAARILLAGGDGGECQG